MKALSVLRSKLGISLIALLLPAFASSANDNTTVQFSSGENRVALVELFTSEGCSSCPPADRWLSKLKRDKGLWQDYVPIAFHVDYWDYIGWDDRFASRENSDRQRRYAREGGVGFVYTPGFISNGEEWLGWRSNKRVGPDTSYGGNLSLLVEGDTVAVHFDNTRLSDQDLTVHIAVLGMNVESDVRAGENKGRVLQHDFVALNVVSTALDSSTSGFKAITNVPATDEPAAEKALVAWVSSNTAQAPLQAVGGFLPGS